MNYFKLFLVFLLFSQVQCDLVTFALKQQNLDLLEDILYRVSDPRSGFYGQYLSVNEIADLIQTHPDHVAQVTKWLSEEGATDIRLLPSRDFIQADVPPSFVDAHLRNHRGSYPAPVTELIDWHFRESTDVRDQKPIGPYRRRFTIEENPSFVQGTPANQKAAYQLPESVRASADTQQMVWGPGTYGFRASDLQMYYKEFDVNNSVDLLHMIGYPGIPGGDNFGEGTLDVTCISSMAMGATTYAVNSNKSLTTEEGPGFGPALLDFVTALANNASVPPMVLSMSLGSLAWDSCNLMCTLIEEEGQFSYDDCLHYVQDEQRQVCMYPSASGQDRISTEFMKLGVRGFTLFAATGDGGSHFSFKEFPNDPLGRALNNISCSYNMPTFPASSPYVTGVGGIQWDALAGPDKPVAWSRSGGSFSWRYPMPSYQEEAVATYLTNNTSILPPSSSYNASMRAYPDVAALSVDIPMVEDGKTLFASGTSASTPTFAGIVTLINNMRTEQGLPVLGFLNPRLYQLAPSAQALYDETVGNTRTSCQYGFSAAIGWDPTTGLGSPLWPGLSSSLLNDN